MKKSNHRFSCSGKFLRKVIAFVPGFFAFVSTNAQPTTVEAPPLPYRESGIAFKVLANIDEGLKRMKYGVQSTYMYSFGSKFGLMGDAGLIVGKIGDADYSKLMLHGGICVIPNDDKISLTPHLLAGFIHDQIKYKFDNSSYTDKGTNFSLLAGADVSIPINKKIDVVATGNYNPTFSSNGVKNNLTAALGINVNIGSKKSPAVGHTPEHDKYVTQPKYECQASRITEELKMSFTAIEKTIEYTEDVTEKIPNVELKIALKPQLTVKRSQQCCSKDKPPVAYTELKGGVEGSMELNLKLWGIPDLKYEITIWPYRIAADFKCKLYWGSTGKINIDGVGGFFGELGDHSRPDCKACWYLNIKGESTLRLGIVAGGGIYFYRWPYKNKKEADEKIEAKAEATVSSGYSVDGTYGSEDCAKLRPGFHGTVNLGKSKADLKFNVKLGPLSFNPKFEVQLLDGYDFKF